MSVITDVILLAGDGEAEAVAAVNGYLHDLQAHLGGDLELAGPSDNFGGTKVPSFAAWGAAFNYLDRQTLLDAICAAPWRYPSSVALVTWHESGSGPQTWTLREALECAGAAAKSDAP